MQIPFHADGSLHSAESIDTNAYKGQLFAILLLSNDRQCEEAAEGEEIERIFSNSSSSIFRIKSHISVC